MRGYACATIGITIRNKSVSWSKPLKIPFSDYKISEIREYEVEIASNRKSARYGE